GEAGGSDFFVKVPQNDRGEFRVSKFGSGDYPLLIAPPVDAPEMRDYLPLFYPATSDRDSAERIFVGPGTHVEGIEVKLSMRGVKITGRFMTDGGKPVRALARLVARPGMVRRANSISLAAAPSIPESMKEEFEIRAVPPGSYFLYAVTDLQSQKTQRFNSRVSPQWIRIPIEVSDHNIDGITVPISPTGSIHGRIRV